MSSLSGLSVKAVSSSLNGLPASSSSQSSLPIAAASNAAQRRIMPLSQKPLPSPPVARTGTKSPTKAGRSLLDASEKPLRRSPPGMPHRQEEWPTLNPRKISTSNASEKYDHQENASDLSYATSVKLGQAKKFPASGAPSHLRPGSEGSAISRVESNVKEEVEVSMASLAPQHVRPHSSTIPIDTVDANATLFQRNSIHESHHSVSSTMSRIETCQTRSTESDDTYVSCSKNICNESSLQGNPAENYVLQELVKLPADNLYRDAVNGTFGCTKMVKPLPGLEAIEESPKADFKIRRLSIASSEVGPTLRIYRSAENIIMGTKSHDENCPDSTQGRHSHHLSEDVNSHQRDTLETPAETDFHQQRFENVTSITDMANQLVGPSKLGSFRKSSRVSGVDNDGKSKTADLSHSLSTNHVRRHSAKPKTSALRKSESFSADDPFFDRRPCSDQGKGCSNASKVQLSVPKQWKKGNSGEWELETSPLLGRNLISSNNQAKSKPAQRKSATEAQLHQDSDMSFRGTWSTKSPREVSNPVGSNATSGNHVNSIELFSTNPAQARGTEIDNRYIFPPRSSSRTMPANYTKSSKTSSVSPRLMHKPQEAAFSNLQSDHESSICDTSALLDLSNRKSRRDSVAQESSKSHRSSSRGVISNIRGFFHKHASSSSSINFAKPVKKDNANTNIAGVGIPIPILTKHHPANQLTLSSKNQPIFPEGRIVTGVHRDRPVSPSAASPVPDDVGATMATAMQLLDSVRMEENSPQKERRLELGTIMVQAITQAKEAEKAMEEAKHAARKADVAFILCKKSVREVAIWVERWRSEMGNESR